jgi:wobble nucleotide-excising tRNase
MTNKIKDKNLNVPDEFKNIYKVLNKLEQRISKLEKVLESHAKCIGELRGTESRIHDLISLK